MSEFSKSEIVGISALLVHAAKIDENYSNDEKDLILHFIDSISDTSIQNKETLKQSSISAIESPLPHNLPTEFSHLHLFSDREVTNKTDLFKCIQKDSDPWRAFRAHLS